MQVPTRWTRRLLEGLGRAEPGREPPASTLEAFFAEVRWSEDVDSGGKRILRRGGL